MTKKFSPGRLRKPAGVTLRELHERVQQGRRSDQTAGKQNQLAHPQNRWQRAVRYNWDKNRGRG
jgi:hypothetical protein